MEWRGLIRCWWWWWVWLGKARHSSNILKCKENVMMRTTARSIISPSTQDLQNIFLKKRIFAEFSVSVNPLIITFHCFPFKNYTLDFIHAVHISNFHASNIYIHAFFSHTCIQYYIDADNYFCNFLFLEGEESTNTKAL